MIKVSSFEDVTGLISARIEEGLTLDYKREPGNNKELAKDMSAFANTEGGTLIYGISSRDRIPTALSWIEGDNIEERIQNVAATSIYPKIEGITVSRYPNPSNEKQAIYVVQVPKSRHAPHMSDNRYYKRHGSISIAMDHEEIKNALLGKGRTTALAFEISANLSLLDKTYTLIERVYVMSPQKRKRIAMVPFHTDAWNAVVASGLMFAFSEEITKLLVETYALIYEINSLIDWLKIEVEPIVHTSADESSFKEAGTYVPAIIRDKLTKLRSLLQQATADLSS
jgi:hypothetical protein